MKKIFITLIILTATLIASFKFIEDKKLAKVTTNDDYDYISINNILMWVSNNGDGSHDPVTDGNGFYWPRDTSLLNTWGLPFFTSAIWEDGLVWGGIVDGDIRANGNTFRQGLQAGKILESGLADDPSLEKYRVYKIRKDWQDLPDGEEKDQYQKDYDEWPVEDGAPWIDVDNDGVFTKGIDQPKHEGDETLWFVSNDLDTTRTMFTYGKPPIGLEIQTTVYGFLKPGLVDVVFKKYKIINKGKYTIEDMFFGQWSEPDLGDAADDFTGCDTLLELLYCWNAKNNDLVYGSPPPAVGYLLLQGPQLPSFDDSAYFYAQWNVGYKNYEWTSFYPITQSDILDHPRRGVPEGSHEMYNVLNGRLRWGAPIINPQTNQVTMFGLAGDPVTQTGWYEGSGWPEGYGWPGGDSPGDRGFFGGMGPIQMAPGDTQEIVIAIAIAKGIDNVNSIQELRVLSRKVRTQFHFNFETPVVPESELSAAQNDTSITLYWNDKSTLYKKGGYKFEGYQVFQCQNMSGDNPQLLKIFDLENEQNLIWDFQNIEGVTVDAPLLLLENIGLEFKFKITKDAYSGNRIYKGSEYFFYITAFAYGEEQAPRFIQSVPQILKVIPGSRNLEIDSPYSNYDFVMADQISGSGDGHIGLDIVDATKLNGHSYKIFFNESDTLDQNGYYSYYEFRYNIVDLTMGDTIIDSQHLSRMRILTRYGWVTDLTFRKPPIVIDGFEFAIQNSGYEGIIASGHSSALKEIVEIKGPDGVVLEKPINVSGSYGSTGDWRILGLSEFDQDSVFEVSNGILKALNWQGKAGQDVYEIRFTTEENGSEYFLTGYQRTHNAKYAAFNDDPKAVGKVPFQIWYMGPEVDDTSDDQRLIIKIQDEAWGSFEVIDSTWSQLGSESKYAGMWETIYAYYPIDSLYPNILPETSGIINIPLEIHKLGHLVLDGNIPEPGTVVRIDTWEPLSVADTFVVTATAPTLNDYAGAKKKLDQISVFPNPYFGTDPFGRFPDRNYIRFTDLPQKVTVRIFTLSGQLVKKIEKESDSPWLDWDLRNRNGKAVASGIYIAHLDMLKIGKKILKLAVVQDNR